VKFGKTKGWTALGVVSGLGLCGLASALPGDPVDAEFRVNLETLFAQERPDVAADAAGNWVVVWQGWGAQGFGVYARRYEAGGSPMGGEVLISADASAADAAVAMDAAGNAFVAWSSTALDGSGRGIAAQRLDGSGRGIAAQRLDGSGTPVGQAVVVNVETAGDQVAPDIALDGAGNAVVVWASQGQDGSGWGVYALRLGADGFPLGGEMAITSTVEGDQMEPAVAVQGDGAFVATWSAPGAAGGRDIYARRFDAADLPREDEFRVSTTEGSLGSPAVAVEPQGHYSIVWHSDGGVGPNADIYGQSFNMIGATGAEFLVNISIAGAQGAPAIAMDPTLRIGNEPKFVVSWQSEGEGILSQRFNRYSEPVGYETLVNTDALAAKSHPAIATDGNGDIVVVWQSEAQDGSEAGIYGQRFSGPEAADLALSLQASADPAAPDSPLTYYVHVDNLPPADGESVAAAATDVVLEFTLPNGTSLVDAQGYGWTCDGSSPLRCELEQPLDAYSGSDLELRLMTPATAGDITLHGSVDAATADSDLFNNLASLTVHVGDATPDAFSFNDVSGVARGSTQTSNAISVQGLVEPAPISVSGGSYSIDGGAFTGSAGTVQPGQSVRLRHVAASTFSGSVDTTLTIGGVADTYTSTTEARDTTPEAFAFTDQSGVAPGSLRTSDAVTVSGINDAATIGISGGSYSINGGAYTSSAGTVQSGDQVRVQHVAAAGFSASVDTTLTIGGVSDSFTSTTEARDTTPAAFSFTDQTNVATGSQRTSNAVTVSGINDAASISVSGGSYSINGGAFTTAVGTVVAGDQVRVQHTSSGAASTTVDTVLTIGGVSDTFSSTTGTADTTPNAFGFADVSGARRSSTVTSAVVTIGGINAATPISVSGGNAQYSRNGGAFTSAAGTVSNGDSIRLRVTASSSANTPLNVTLTVGGVSDVWTVTTGTK